MIWGGQPPQPLPDNSNPLIYAWIRFKSIISPAANGVFRALSPKIVQVHMYGPIMIDDEQVTKRNDIPLISYDTVVNT